MKYINILHSFKINKRLRLMLFLETILLTIGYFFIASGYNHIARQKTEDSISQLNHTLVTEVDYGINTLSAITRYPYVSIPYQVTDTVWTYLTNPEKLEENRTAYNNLFIEMYYKLNLLFPQLDSIFIYDYDGNFLSFQNNGLSGSSLAADVSGVSWFTTTKVKNGELYFLDREEILETGYQPHANTLFSSRALAYVTLPRPAGIILAGLNVSDIITQFNNHRVFESEVFAVFDSSGKLLLSSASGQPDVTMGEYTKDTARYNYNWSSNSKGTIHCIIRTDKADIAGASFRMNLILFLLIPFILLANILLTSLIVQSINKPLDRMVEACKHISSGDFSVRIEYEGTDEIASLTESFNQMAEQVQLLITQVYQKSITEKELELQMLRSQINPHFLYNTLDSMRMAALNSGYEDYARMCELLAKILRYGVTNSHRMVEVEEEVSHLKDYIELIGLRFGNSIHFNIMIDPAILHYHIIRLLLQPIVENSINHGIKDSIEKGQIQIWGFKREKVLIFTISDNGAGMAEAEVLQLQDYIDNKNEAYKSIGIKNIQRRIKLNYGEEYGITLKSRPYQGTSVTITVPITEEEWEEDE